MIFPSNRLACLAALAALSIAPAATAAQPDPREVAKSCVEAVVEAATTRVQSNLQAARACAQRIVALRASGNEAMARQLARACAERITEASVQTAQAIADGVRRCAAASDPDGSATTGRGGRPRRGGRDRRHPPIALDGDAVDRDGATDTLSESEPRGALGRHARESPFAAERDRPGDRPDQEQQHEARTAPGKKPCAGTPSSPMPPATLPGSARRNGSVRRCPRRPIGWPTPGRTSRPPPAGARTKNTNPATIACANETPLLSNTAGTHRIQSMLRMLADATFAIPGALISNQARSSVTKIRTTAGTTA